MKDQERERYIGPHTVHGRNYNIIQLGVELCFVPEKLTPANIVEQDMAELDIPEEAFYTLRPIEEILMPTI